MAILIAMPKLSDTMDEGIILKWLKKEGQTIKQGEILAEVQTDKADMELEAYDGGVVRKLFVPEGAGVPVGRPIAIIGGVDEDISALVAEAGAASLKKSGSHVGTSPGATPTAVLQTSANAEPDSRVKASPLAKKLAEELRVDLTSVIGTGPNGRIVKQDVEAQVSRPSSIPAHRVEVRREDVAVPLSLMRKTIAKRLTESKVSAPHFYLNFDVDMKRAIEFRSAVNAASDQKISFNDIIVKAVAMALRHHPSVNASFGGDKIIQHGAVHVGIAVAIDEGLITPVLRNADQKGIAAISAESKELAARAREKKLKPEEFSGGTFTVSNLGMFGVDSFTAIINPPEGAILAVGAIIEKPVVENGHIVVGSRLMMTLSCDHRVIDGATGAQFMQELKKILENPALLAL
ncbi:MAG: dihydrolipoamide acetyltransferase family protein [Ignavibacteriales bacterium]|nr:dihydrolipoamide acetyltransferase family protein [Ignavibacteriales bacterium]